MLMVFLCFRFNVGSLLWLSLEGMLIGIGVVFALHGFVVVGALAFCYNLHEDNVWRSVGEQSEYAEN
ncbi:hypothetical protein QVD17_41267 [Tagetes erecta]|uniref:Uncharacterized protein n=1 Tax=Tagetes erecta TaxID=13708 RepID=A0AAD8NGK1_TARER|nr:hypothetical protein QVD17_41267 [Tagetes erecta]